LTVRCINRPLTCWSCVTLTPGLPDNFGWVEYWDETSPAPVIDLWPLVAIPDGDVWSCPFLFSGDEFVGGGARLPSRRLPPRQIRVRGSRRYVT